MRPHKLGRGVFALLLALGVAPLGWGAVSSPDFPALNEREFKPAALGPREPRLEIDYPGGARMRGVTHGRAVVSVLVGADGQPQDFFVSSAADPAFGAALLDRVRTLTYQAALFRGTPVPARLDVGYQFDALGATLDVMDASRQLSVKSDRAAEQTPVLESKLDHPLEFTDAALPRLPKSYQPTSDEPVRVFVTFYVDGEGHTYAPNVESAPAPVLFSGAIKAVRQWTFQPPTQKGKPVTVFAARSVSFIPRTPAPEQSPAGEKKAE
ncbi:energy transducer TonB [Opitutus terrae]|uniref:TonB family protein n=1 Tax=Opitutus terrae (strain DSM 11246 / JCM 15787 / PB90-1) TaxID=452637 RepID=B1ZUV8_OPITP|nr:energy transducer TonB [Opitutus terrae]ACB75928.1 TonB family protein [Opitutus terrae PB90-1]